jgi:hypothetical protein
MSDQGANDEDDQRGDASRDLPSNDDVADLSAVAKPARVDSRA